MIQLDTARPNIVEIKDPAEVLRAMIAYRRRTQKNFSVLRACRGLYRVSPALITLILKGKRKITRDRVDELAQLMQITPAEKTYFKNLVIGADAPTAPTIDKGGQPRTRNRKQVGTHILNDWLNVYVKDCFQIESVQKNPELLYRQLAPISSNARIKKSLEFLLEEGHLRRTLEGYIVPEANLTVTDPGLPSAKIRQFHKSALKIAHQAIDLHGFHERFANTMLIAMSPQKYQEFLATIQEFAERMQQFAEAGDEKSDRLYQLIVNLSPTGGKVE